MPTSYRPYFPDQGLLLPSSLSEWLPEDHLAYFVIDSNEPAQTEGSEPEHLLDPAEHWLRDGLTTSIVRLAFLGA
jgi:hypothetical protein